MRSLTRWNLSGSSRDDVNGMSKVVVRHRHPSFLSRYCVRIPSSFMYDTVIHSYFDRRHFIRQPIVGDGEKGCDRQNRREGHMAVMPTGLTKTIFNRMS